MPKIDRLKGKKNIGIRYHIWEFFDIDQTTFLHTSDQSPHPKLSLYQLNINKNYKIAKKKYNSIFISSYHEANAKQGQDLARRKREKSQNRNKADANEY